MSVGQPPNLPPPPPGYPPPPPAGVMSPPLYGGTMPAPPAPARRGWFDFKGMRWWEIVLAGAPLLLVPIGGLSGGLFGVAASAINVAISRSRMSTAVKIVLMLATVFVACVAWLIVAIIIYAAIHSAAGG